MFSNCPAYRTGWKQWLWVTQETMPFFGGYLFKRTLSNKLFQAYLAKSTVAFITHVKFAPIATESTVFVSSIIIRKVSISIIRETILAHQHNMPSLKIADVIFLEHTVNVNISFCTTERLDTIAPGTLFLHQKEELINSNQFFV